MLSILLTLAQGESMSESAVPKQSNGLGVAGLVIGLVALVFSVVPLVNVTVPFLAVIGLVLGVVGLLRKGRKKGIAIAGAIISLAAIFSSVAFASIYADSFNDAISTDVEVIEEADGGSEDQGAEQGETEASEGTRDNPLPMGSAIKFGEDWEITVGPSILKANDLVASENQFNDSAPEGFQYAILTLEFTYVGASSGTPWTSVSVDYISPSGTTHSESDSFVSYVDDFFSINELFPGGSGTGNVVIAIPEDGAADGVWRIEPLFIGDGVFFSAN
jgi:hypothetical protein